MLANWLRCYFIFWRLLKKTLNSDPFSSKLVFLILLSFAVVRPISTMGILHFPFSVATSFPSFQSKSMSFSPWVTNSNEFLLMAIYEGGTLAHFTEQLHQNIAQLCINVLPYHLSYPFLLKTPPSGLPNQPCQG